MDLEKLKGAIPDSVYDQLADTCAKFNINSNLRLCHFMSQCEHESNVFRSVYENLNYSAEGLLKVFSKYFDATSAQDYARKPEKIANRVYASRMGNGSERSGDGWKYRGRGYIQLTGRNNYIAFTNALNVPEGNCAMHPDLVATKYPLSSAGFFFDINKIWRICDIGSTDGAISSVTRKVNGGLIGLDDRIARFRKFEKVLNKGV